MLGKLIMVLLGAGILCALALGAEKAPAEKKALRVGVYDSRAIAIAYSASKHNDLTMIEKSKEKKKAEEAGNTAEVEKIDKWMMHYSMRRHLQGFSGAPVHDLLEPVKGEIPRIARDAGVDLVVSKWDTDYLGKDVQTVDLTMQLVKLYDPISPRAMKWVDEIVDKPLIDEDVVLREQIQGGH